MSCSEEPNANSTMVEPRLCSQTEPCLKSSNLVTNQSLRRNSTQTCVPRNITPKSYLSGECSSVYSSVGDMNHIPRIPPSPTTYTLPSVSKSPGTTMCGHEEYLFGMIKLGDNDVCYTSGTIEWVGRKRSYPINSGFKIINEQFSDTQLKKMRKLNNTLTCDKHGRTGCDCADVLPTVNAIVDHLNALHEAVDLVDLRLNTLEDGTDKTYRK